MMLVVIDLDTCFTCFDVNFRPLYRFLRLLFLVAGILLFSCQKGEQQSGQEEELTAELEGMMSQQSEDLTIINSKLGKLTYRVTTALVERYEFAREPYTEFRKGVSLVTFNDSTHHEESSLTANYAIYLEHQKLWEAKGNVVATNAKGQKLETEQLFWNERTERIYSNVDCRVTFGNDIFVGEGFESDDKMEFYTFRRPIGRVTVDVSPGTDTSALASAPSPPVRATAASDTSARRSVAPPTIRQGEAVARPNPAP